MLRAWGHLNKRLSSYPPFFSLSLPLYLSLFRWFVCRNPFIRLWIGPSICRCEWKWHTHTKDRPGRWIGCDGCRSKAGLHFPFNKPHKYISSFRRVASFTVVRLSYLSIFFVVFFRWRGALLVVFEPMPPSYIITYCIVWMNECIRMGATLLLAFWEFCGKLLRCPF